MIHCRCAWAEPYFYSAGAVAVRLLVYDTSISLINCHLSSGQSIGDSLKRHLDCEEILRRGVVPAEGQSNHLKVSFTQGVPWQVQSVPVARTSTCLCQLAR